MKLYFWRKKNCLHLICEFRFAKSPDKSDAAKIIIKIAKGPIIVQHNNS